MHNLSKHLRLLVLALLAGISLQFTSKEKSHFPANSLTIPPRGISIHIGLNFVDPGQYGNWDGKLNAAEFDAKDMLNLTTALHFKPTPLIRQNATRAAVIAALRSAAATLKAGDLLIVTYSGHGGQVPDDNHDEADDGLDETWCLYDGELVDDELYAIWTQFAAGVRILVISDSCHSGSVIKLHGKENKFYASKNLPESVAEKTYQQHKTFYDKIQKGMTASNQVPIKASIKLLSACKDDELSYDGQLNGAFTGALREVWAFGKYNGNYETFKDLIKGKLNNQTPGLLNQGQLNDTFNQQKPFTL
jgi:hypothetical protein